MSEKPIKENSFEAGVSGMSGMQNVQPGWSTFSSPNVSQDPSQFATTGGNVHKSPSRGTMASSGSAEMARDVGKLFKKRDVPTIDDVVAGIDWEMSQMVVKDKRMAKQKVIENLKKNPHFYSDLDQLNINMDKTPEEIEKERQIAERKKIFEDMATDRPNKRDLDPRVTSIMREMWDAKQRKRFNA